MVGTGFQRATLPMRASLLRWPISGEEEMGNATNSPWEVSVTFFRWYEARGGPRQLHKLWADALTGIVDEDHS
jgi:hypothetical protein